MMIFGFWDTSAPDTQGLLAMYSVLTNVVTVAQNLSSQYVDSYSQVQTASVIEKHRNGTGNTATASTKALLASH